MKIIELTVEYWDRAFESRGYILEDNRPNQRRMDESQFKLPKAKLAALRTFIKQYTWYYQGEFHIGFNREQLRKRLPVNINIIYKGSERWLGTNIHLALPGVLPDIRLQTVVDYREFLFVLGALSSPAKLPLCIDIDWIKEILSEFLLTTKES
jgi:hypothetical protein